MEILFTRFPLESHYGGAEVQTLSLMKGLKERGHEVMFLGSCATLLEKCGELRIENEELRIGDPPVTKWEAVSFLWRKFEMGRKLIAEVTKCLDMRQHVIPSSPSISEGVSRDSAGATRHDMCVFMLSFSEKLLLTEWAVAQGMRVFWLEHDRVGRWLTMNPWLPTLRRLSHLATTIVVSDLSRDLYLELGWNPERVISIPNGIDVEHFTNNNPKTYLPSEAPGPRSLLSAEVLTKADGEVGLAKGGHLTPTTFHIGCIARLTRDKGVDLLIKAVAELSNIALTIVGTGRDRMLAAELIRRLTRNRSADLSSRVTILSSVPDIAAFYQTIDCLVLPSRSHDPFGLVVAEAMAAGIPTIVTEACGIAQHLNPDEALIVPGGNVSALKNAIETLIRFPQLARNLAERGPMVARERFSLKKMVDAYEALLNREPANSFAS